MSIAVEVEVHARVPERVILSAEIEINLPLAIEALSMVLPFISLTLESVIVEFAILTPVIVPPTSLAPVSVASIKAAPFRVALVIIAPSMEVPALERAEKTTLPAPFLTLIPQSVPEPNSPNSSIVTSASSLTLICPSAPSSSNLSLPR